MSKSQDRDRQEREAKTEFGIVLADGTEHVWQIADHPVRPRHWKSWVMGELPYGTEYFGCTWFVR
jgi:hypothetical protein